jgi:hypothetical protein
MHVIEYLVIISTCKIHASSRIYAILVLRESWLGIGLGNKMQRNTKTALGFKYYQLLYPHSYEGQDITLRIPI